MVRRGVYRVRLRRWVAVCREQDDDMIMGIRSQLSGGSFEGRRPDVVGRAQPERVLSGAIARPVDDGSGLCQKTRTAGMPLAPLRVRTLARTRAFVVVAVGGADGVPAVAGSWTCALARITVTVRAQASPSEVFGVRVSTSRVLAISTSTPQDPDKPHRTKRAANTDILISRCGLSRRLIITQARLDAVDGFRGAAMQS